MPIDARVYVAQAWTSRLFAELVAAGMRTNGMALHGSLACRRFKIPAAIFATLIAGWLMAACGGGTSADTSTAAQDVTITAQDISFTSPSLRLKAGHAVRLTLVNSGALEHDITIPGLNDSDAIVDPADHGGGMTHAMNDMAPGTVHMAAASGARAMVEFTPKAGSYEFYCSVPGHREAGMVGTIVVQ